MDYSKKQIEQLLAELTRQRDQFKVRLYFSRDEVRSEWFKLEPKFERLRIRLETMLNEVDRGAVSGSPSLDVAVDQIKTGYQKVRQMMR
jgi:hypothetical protein